MSTRRELSLITWLIYAGLVTYGLITDPSGMFWMFLIVSATCGLVWLVILVCDKIFWASIQRGMRRERELEEARWQEEVREIEKGTQP